MAYGLLPGISLEWDTYAGTDTFLRYILYRRKQATVDWAVIASIDDIGENFHTDFTAESGQLYEYTVTVDCNVFGDIVESEKQSPPVTESVTFEDVAIHNVVDATEYAILQARAMRVTPVLEVAYVQARGRTKPTAQYGESESSRIQITPAEHVVTDIEDWYELRAMYTAQRAEGAIYLVRPGHVPDHYYVQIDSLERDDVQVLAQIGVEFQEVFYDE